MHVTRGEGIPGRLGQPLFQIPATRYSDQEQPVARGLSMRS